MSYIIGILISGAILGIIIVLREGEFPGWGPLCGIVLASGAAQGLVGIFIPTPFDLLSAVIGAGVAALIISWLLESPFRRSAVTAGIWFAVLVVLSLFWSLVS